MTNRQLHEIAVQYQAKTGVWPEAICPKCGAPENDSQADEHIEVYSNGKRLLDCVGCCGHCDFVGAWPEDFNRHDANLTGQQLLF